MAIPAATATAVPARSPSAGRQSLVVCAWAWAELPTASWRRSRLFTSGTSWAGIQHRRHRHVTQPGRDAYGKYRTDSHTDEHQACDEDSWPPSKGHVDQPWPRQFPEVTQRFFTWPILERPGTGPAGATIARIIYHHGATFCLASREYGCSAMALRCNGGPSLF